MLIRRIAAPAQEPIDLLEAKEQCRVDHQDEDARIYSFMRAARQQLENERGVALITQTWELGLPEFPCGASGWGLEAPIIVPKPPLQSVTSVKYLDSAGVLQTWDPSKYQVVNQAGPKARRAAILPAYGQVYPSTLPSPEAVTIRFVAGFGASAVHVPEPLRQALLLHVAELYADRESRIVGTIVSQRDAYERLVASCVEIAA